MDKVQKASDPECCTPIFRMARNETDGGIQDFVSLFIHGLEGNENNERTVNSRGAEFVKD
jgi:hypothetical protein